MHIHRRHFIAGLGALSFTGLVPLPGNAANRGTGTLYIGANRAPDGSYHVAGLTPSGGRAFEIALPSRGHGIAVRPDGKQAIAAARRPGRFGLVIDVAEGRIKTRLKLPPARHFYGHGAFSADGRLLFTTENDIDTGNGIVGVWDAANNYQRLREFPSHGIGPHELLLAPDGRTLVVANGGILTHPDTGRRKLNIPTMTPSLAYIDPADGRLIEAHGFDDPRHRLLSIRHLALRGDGTVGVALQDEGPKGDMLPVVAFHRQGERTLDLAAAPHGVARRLNGYAGSAALAADGRTLAISAPRGGLITFWDVERRAFIDTCRITDGCGVAPLGKHDFIATSGQGGAFRLDHHESRLLSGPFARQRQWDNHLIPAVPQA